MENQYINSFYFIGISTRTTNENGQSGQDIPALWQKFLGENLLSNIPDKIDNIIYCIYTDYEGDYTKPYTTSLGCKVTSLQNIPEGYNGLEVSAGRYLKFTAKGNIQQGSVFNEWVKIWEAAIPRGYTFDLEVYDERASNPEDAVVDIFISVR